MIEYIECRNLSRTVIGIISNFNSVIWQTEYLGTGNFQIVVPYSNEYFEWLQPNNYVTRNGRNELGFIETVGITFTPDTGKKIVAEGRFGIVLLERRLLADLFTSRYRVATQAYGDNTAVEWLCRTIVTNTLVNPDWSNRRVSWVSVCEWQGFNAAINGNSYVADNALEFLTHEMKSAYNDRTSVFAPLGHRMYFDKSSLTMEYQLFEGRITDLVFSQQYNNLLSLNYTHDTKNYKTAFLIGGEGDGADKFFTFRNRTNDSGEKRREYLFDSQKSQSGIEINGTTVLLSNSDYAKLLQADCAANFSDFRNNISASGTIDVSSLEYGTDYIEGDVVTLRDEETQINIRERIWSVTEVLDENGNSITANFDSGT